MAALDALDAADLAKSLEQVRSDPGFALSRVDPRERCGT